MFKLTRKAFECNNTFWHECKKKTINTNINANIDLQTKRRKYIYCCVENIKRCCH